MTGYWSRHRLLLSVNTEIVMQTADAEYTDLVCWNTKQLEKHGIPNYGYVFRP